MIINENGHGNKPAPAPVKESKKGAKDAEQKQEATQPDGDGSK